MNKWFSSLDELKKSYFILFIITIVVSLCLLPTVFFDMYDILFGWLFGSLIEFAALFLLIKGADELSKSASNKNGFSLSILFYFGARFLLYAIGLTIAALCTFYWKIKLFNIFSTVAAFIPMSIVLRIVFGYTKKPTIGSKYGPDR